VQAASVERVNGKCVLCRAFKEGCKLRKITAVYCKKVCGAGLTRF
jgi:hypothetical protein